MLSKELLHEAFFSFEREEICEEPNAIKAWKEGFHISDKRWSEYLSKRGSTESSFSSQITSSQPKKEMDGWIKQLNTILSGSYGAPIQGIHPRYGSQRLDKLPFETFFRPFVNHYMELITYYIPSNVEISPKCISTIKENLSSELLKETLLCLLDWHNSSNLTAEEYEILFHQKTGFISFFQKYAVLPRVLIETAQAFTDLILTILFHLENDWNELRASDLVRGSSPNIDSLHTGLGDKHRGKTVCRLAGLDYELYYRPRSAPEFQFYNQVIRTLGADRLLPPIKHLNFDDHCWVFSYKAGSIQEITATDYIYRLGLLGAIFHSLGSKDMHFENIVATSSGPVPVDLETIIAPSPENNTHRSDELAQLLVNDSPLGTGVFPVGSSMSGEEIEVSSLIGGLKSSKSKVQNIVFNNDGSVTLASQDVHTKPSSSSLRGMTYDDLISNYPHVLAGLKHGLNLVKSAEEDLLLHINNYRDREVRVLLRPTALYDLTLQALRHPSYMKSMLSRERFMLRLWQKVEDQPFEPSVEQISSEENQLLAGNIPYFTVSSSRLDPSGHYRLTALERANQQVYRACDANQLIQDLSFVQESIIGALGIQPTTKLSLPKSCSEPHADLIMEIADCTYQKFVDNAILSSSDVTWLGFTSSTEGGTVRLSPLGTGMYDGLSGIAVGLSSFYRVSHDRSVRRLVQMLIGTLHREANLLDASRFTPIGAFSGLSGILYAIYFSEKMLGLESSLSSTNSERTWINRLSSRIQGDTYLDVTSGSAGALAVTCCLIENGIWTTDQSKSLLKELQKKLLVTAEKIPGYLGNGWPTGDSHIMLGGFSHGSTGIATALARSNRICFNKDVEACAQGGIEFDDNFLSPENGLWIDQRPELENSEITPNQWCHGASGIILGRSLVHKWNRDNNQDLLNSALVREESASIPQNHSLCHGLFGNTYCFKEANQKTFTSSFGKSFDSLLNNGFRAGLSFDLHSVPGLMTGLSGLLYAMSAYLDRNIPNILWLE